MAVTAPSTASTTPAMSVHPQFRTYSHLIKEHLRHRAAALHAHKNCGRLYSALPADIQQRIIGVTPDMHITNRQFTSPEFGVVITDTFAIGVGSRDYGSRIDQHTMLMLFRKMPVDGQYIQWMAEHHVPRVSRPTGDTKADHKMVLDAIFPDEYPCCNKYVVSMNNDGTVKTSRKSTTRMNRDVLLTLEQVYTPNFVRPLVPKKFTDAYLVPLAAYTTCLWAKEEPSEDVCTTLHYDSDCECPPGIMLQISFTHWDNEVKPPEIYDISSSYDDSLDEDDEAQEELALQDIADENDADVSDMENSYLQ